ncbi:hypothetical protein J6590_099703, partial [Homalodisca vitripennis]
MNEEISDASDGDVSNASGDIGTDLDDCPSDNSVHDYSSGSGEEYNPNLDTNVYTDSDDNTTFL